ncbi:acetyltransferase [Chitinibacter sp. ZOR0017]|uniref:acetyltransferase n=1 Tax=Chitinibacter sp. ZOR0017 TaxID=1339254 RepID=UPI0009E04B94|nr:acetyltransferase [Chitinibacter sp. ZOR0017]
MKSLRWILVGAGGFGRELICWADDCLESADRIGFSGFLDSNAGALDNFSYQLDWLGSIESYNPQENDRFILGVGDPATKQKIVNALKAKGAIFGQLIHPSATIAKTAILGEGVIVCPHSLVSADCSIGSFVSINALSSVGHDAFIGDYVTLSAHVDLTGGVKVGDFAFFGTGAKVLPKVSIGENSLIGAGAIIIRTVKPGSVMYAQPAKKL